MNAQHPIPNPRVLLSVSMLLCAALVFGCQDTETPVGPELDSPVASETAGVTFAGAKPICPGEHPSCNDDGDSGSAFNVAMTGGLVAAPQVLGTFKENKRQISGRMDVFTVQLNLMETQSHATVLQRGDALPAGCSFTCDDPVLDCDVGGLVYNSLANAFVTNPPALAHPTEPTSDYDGIDIGFNKDGVGDKLLSNCPFTGIADFEPPAGGGVLIRNCFVTGNIENSRIFTVEADPANTVSTARRIDTDGKEGLGPQDPRVSLKCSLMDEFTVTFAPVP